MNKELFKLKVIYFRLYNLLEIFQRMINSIFWEVLHEGVLANYIDNFIIPFKTRKKLEEQTIQFLKIAEKYNFCFKQSKCDFDTEKISILRVVAGREEVQIENNKVKAIKKWKTSTKVKKVENFLEFTNFYQYFIKNFSYMVKSLNKL